jgi:hypothetical protein
MDVLPAAAHFHTEVGEIIVLFDVSPWILIWVYLRHRTHYLISEDITQLSIWGLNFCEQLYKKSIFIYLWMVSFGSACAIQCTF